MALNRSGPRGRGAKNKAKHKLSLRQLTNKEPHKKQHQNKHPRRRNPSALPPDQPPPPTPDTPPTQGIHTQSGFGASLYEKPTKHLRVFLIQTRQVPLTGGDDRQAHLNQNLLDYTPDVVLLTEMGVNWHKLGTEAQWSERLATKFPRRKTRVAMNMHEATKRSNTAMTLPGGTGITLLNEAVARTQELESDPTNLGRWVSAKIQGRQGKCVRVVAAYRPTENKDTTMTTWMQQSRYYRETRQDDRCPRTIFLEDLKTTIQPWIDAGDQVIVGIDANEDVRQGATHSMFRSIGMKDAILTKYRTSPPETYQRNFQRKPIDAIFVTTGIKIT